jgi:hypothetical protein
MLKKIILSFIIFIPILSISQTAGSGLWSSKNVNVLDKIQTQSCGANGANYSFSINDTLYIGGKSVFVRYNRLENSFTELALPPYTFDQCNPTLATNQSFVINRIAYVFLDRYLYSYNPTQNKWTGVQNFPGLNLEDASISVSNEKAYIMGGLKPAVVGSPRSNSNDVWVFDPIPKSFVQLSNMPVAANGRLNSSSLGNKIYYNYGRDNFFEYNPITDSWTRKPSPSIVSRNPAGVVQYESIIGMFSFQNDLYLTTCTTFLSTYGNRRVFKWDSTNETWNDIGITSWPGNSGIENTSIYVPTSREVFDIGMINNRTSFYERTMVSWTTKTGVIQSSSVIKENNKCINSGDSFNLQYSYTAKGSFQTGNKFYLEISDQYGVFQGKKLDSVQTAVTTSYNGTFNVVVPSNLWDTLSKYRVRVTSTLPLNDDDYATYLKDLVVYNPNVTTSLSTPGICQGSFTKISLNPQNAQTYTWYKNNVLINGQSNSFLLVTDPGTYFAIVNNSSNCTGQTGNITLTVTSLPSAPSVTNATYCVGASASALSATAISGSTLNWYGTNATGGTASGSAPTPSTTTAGNLNYYVSQVATATGCESPRSTLGVTINALPSAPSVTNATYCVGASASALSATAISGSTLNWYGINATGGTASGSAPTPSTTTAGTVNYYVSQVATATGCESPRAKLVVGIYNTPNAPVLSRDLNNFLVTNVSGITWFRDGVQLLDTTQKIKPTIAGSYTVKTTQNGCASLMSTPYYFLVTDVINLSATEFIKLVPNPFINYMNIDFVVKGYQRMNIDVFSAATGAKVATRIAVTAGSRLTFNELNPGIYFVRIASPDMKVSHQFKMVKL